jgi:hypothetical protein
MRDVSELRADLLDGRLAASRDPEDASSGARIARVAQLADRGDHAAAAREAADLLEARLYDVRLIGFYLFGLFLERGIRYLPLLLGHVGRLVSDELAALGPSRRKLQVVSSATAWLFENVSARLQYHTKQRDALWESWRAASDSALADAIAAGCTKVTLALEAAIDAPLAATPLARVRRWTQEDLRRAVARREVAAQAVAVVAPPPAPHVDEPADDLPDEPDEPGDDMHAPDPRSDQAVDRRDSQAFDRRSDPAIDRRGSQTVDRRDSQALDRRSNQAIDRRSGHAVDPRGNQAIERRGSQTSDRRSGPLRDRRNGQVQDRRSNPPRARHDDPARDRLDDDPLAWNDRTDGDPAPESPALVALRAKLYGFQDLVARGELAKAAVVASDVRTLLANFDPVAFFPAMFAGYFRALHRVVDELAPYLDGADQPAWHALDSYYRADMRGFFDD